MTKDGAVKYVTREEVRDTLLRMDWVVEGAPVVEEAPAPRGRKPKVEVATEE